jgi:short subunit dehydrogenase-like uncharacterized protein
MNDWLLYGATGYTGRLIAEEAARRGMSLALGGRDAKRLEPIAKQLNLPMRIFALDDPAAIDRGLDGMRAVLHCAGPFTRTSAPMIEGCLRAKCHYLDITGEISVIEHAAQQDARAKAAGVTVMPAVGFDVVPSDCLARALADALPGATHLKLAFTALTDISPGTAKTMLEMFPQGGRVRIDGEIRVVPAAWKQRKVPFRTGSRQAITIPWGDVASAFYTTGIPNIETYIAVPAVQRFMMKAFRFAAPLFRVGFVATVFERLIDWTVRGPNDDRRRGSRTSFWGEVNNARGDSVTGTLETSGGYELTIHAALACLEQVLAGRAPVGFQTPAGAFGKDFILRMPGSEMHVPAE